MAVQEGFLYEENVAKALKKRGWVRKSYAPAKAASDRPDLEFLFEGKTYGCELKKDLASAGSLVIHHLGNKKYEFGETEGSKEKEFLKGIGIRAGVLNAIRQKWRTEPFIQKDRDRAWVKRATNSGLSLRQRYNHDIKACPDIYFQLPNTTISRYYNLKDTHYINVATHGFYLLGPDDPAGLNDDKFGVEGVPKWEQNHTAILRIRIQSKGVSKAEQQENKVGAIKEGAGQGYQITMEIAFKGVRRSYFNIGPTIGKSATINESKIILPERVENGTVQ